MDSAAVSFAASLQRGRIGEGLIASWFQRRGFHVLPVYEKELDTGKGPTLFRAAGRPLIAPDMVVFRTSGKTLWIEAKTKSAFTWYRQGQSWDTGVDRRHFEDYLRVADLSPWPVWLLFLHFDGQAKDSPSGCPTGLFGNEINQLRERVRYGRGDGTSMVYWKLGCLKKIAILEQVLDNKPSRFPVVQQLTKGGLTFRVHPDSTGNDELPF